MTRLYHPALSETETEACKLIRNIDLEVDLILEDYLSASSS